MKIKFLQTQEHPCYILNCFQHQGLKAEKVYTSKISDSMSIALFEEEVPEEFSLDVYLDVHMKKLTK